MKTPKNIAFRISIIVSLVTLALVFLIGDNAEKFSLLSQALVISLVVLAVSFFLVSFYLEKFLLEKVKVIYKTINNFKSSNPSSSKESAQAGILEEVNKDVEAWSQDKLGKIEELQNQENFRKEFIGNLSHELKTPLFSIQGYILTLLDGALDDHKHNHLFLTKAAKSVDRMTALLDDLDEVTNLEGGELPLEKSRFDIVALTKEIFELFESSASENNIEFRFKVPNPKPEFVYADRDKITQVITNLLVNSVKYGSDHGYTEVRFYDMDDSVLIEIKDNGIGVSQKHLPRLFERFYRVDKSRSRHVGGTGLGLAITKHIIEAHGHEITARSLVDKGSTFTFSLSKD